jgi:hypothetical protein
LDERTIGTPGVRARARGRSGALLLVVGPLRSVAISLRPYARVLDGRLRCFCWRAGQIAPRVTSASSMTEPLVLPASRCAWTCGHLGQQGDP